MSKRWEIGVEAMASLAGSCLDCGAERQPSRTRCLDCGRRNSSVTRRFIRLKRERGQG